MTPKPRLRMKSLYSLLVAIFLIAAASFRDLGWNPLGRGDAAPGPDLSVAAGRFFQGRHVRIERCRRIGQHGQALHLAGVDQRARLGQRYGRDLDAARDQILQSGRGAVRRHPWHAAGSTFMSFSMPAIARCQIPPCPVPDALNLPGLALIAATSSVTFL